MKNCFFLFLFLLFQVAGLPQIRCGAERTGLYYPHLRHKNIAVVANAASVVGKVNVVDTLLHNGLKVEKIFCPEHGFRIFSDAGQTVKNSVDSATKLPVISLYGKKKKPDPADLKDIDIVVFDLQDVGVRFYTYLSTLSFMMEACSQANIPLMVFDRPNPNGFYIDGPVMDSSQYSFVGLHPVPVVYGMTIGEYAKMINEEGWLKDRMICDLQVIPLENYTHMSQYQLPVKPSPNLTDMNAIYLYPSLCFFEGTIISVGRGTPYPFEVYGHPAFKGFAFEFTPQPVKGLSNPLYSGQLCRGLDLRDFYKTHPRLFGRLNLTWLIMAYKTLRSDPHFFNDSFDRLAGTSSLRKQITEGKTEQEIRQGWQEGLERFKEIRKKYLIYPE
ncbi:MAG: DUF1343 domain-containing protein [Bacteroidetes bacterium]|nr:MAG: DUF1343 domain-containing protein [Bacteroidota bacterium]